MTTPRELLARVAAHPEDDEARLAYARALPPEEAPRAEFIRTQVQLAGRGLDPQRRQMLLYRVNELLGSHDEAWADRLRALGASDFRFARGFVGEVSLTEAALADHGEQLLALEPVTRVRVETGDGEGLARAASRPWFSQLRSLWLSGQAVTEAAQALASAPHAARLTFLVLAGVDKDGVAALTGSESLPGLRSLGLTGNDSLGDVATGLLARTRLALTTLYLSATEVTDEGTAMLARAKPLQALEVLALNRNAISDEGAGSLAASKVLTGLRHLELEKTELSEEGALAFARARALPALRRLDLRGMGLSDDALGPLRKRLGAGLKL